MSDSASLDAAVEIVGGELSGWGLLWSAWCCALWCMHVERAPAQGTWPVVYTGGAGSQGAQSACSQDWAAPGAEPRAADQRAGGRVRGDENAAGGAARSVRHDTKHYDLMYSVDHGIAAGVCRNSRRSWSRSGLRRGLPTWHCRRSWRLCARFCCRPRNTEYCLMMYECTRHTLQHCSAHQPRCFFATHPLH